MRDGKGLKQPAKLHSTISWHSQVQNDRFIHFTQGTIFYHAKHVCKNQARISLDRMLLSFCPLLLPDKKTHFIVHPIFPSKVHSVMSPPFSCVKQDPGSHPNTWGPTASQATTSSLCWQMDISLTMRPGKTLDLRRRLVQHYTSSTCSHHCPLLWRWDNCTLVSYSVRQNTILKIEYCL